MQWKTHLIDSIFLPVEAEQIKSIPLNTSRRDTMIWNSTPNGQFTTQSAYQFQAATKSSFSASTSDPSRTHSFWKSVWGMTVPNKIKMFMWRACNSSLPTKTNLFNRGVLSSSSCPVCQDEAKTILHIFWNCPYARSAWFNSPLHKFSNSLRVSVWSDVVEEVLKEQCKHTIEVFFTLAWMIWGHRNNVWLQKPSVAADCLGEKATAYMEEYRAVLSKVEDSSSIMVHKWRPPPAPSVKLNFATTVFRARNFVGMGAMIRNCRGEFMAGYCEEFPRFQDGLHSATAAMITALQFSWEAGFQHIMVEFSNPHLLALIQSNDACLTEIGDHIDHIRSYSNFFTQLAFSVVFGSSNRAAKLLAGYAKVTKEPSIWLEEGPSFVLPIVLEELS